MNSENEKNAGIEKLLTQLNSGEESFEKARMLLVWLAGEFGEKQAIEMTATTTGMPPELVRIGLSGEWTMAELMGWAAKKVREN